MKWVLFGGVLERPTVQLSLTLSKEKPDKLKLQPCRTVQRDHLKQMTFKKE